jgi:hypothetical protein
MATSAKAPLDLEIIKERIGLGPDKIYGVIGEFDTPEELVEAGKRIYGMGYRKLDAMTPFPVHGIDDAIGIPRSHLGWIVICVGLMGSATALLLMWWCGTINYPLVIGGKPLFDFSFAIPITFELTVLFSAFASLLGMLAINGLPRLYHPSMNYRNAHRATDDKFLLVIEASDPKFEAEQVSADMKSVGAGLVEVVVG